MTIPLGLVKEIVSASTNLTDGKAHTPEIGRLKNAAQAIQKHWRDTAGVRGRNPFHLHEMVHNSGDLGRVVRVDHGGVTVLYFSNGERVCYSWELACTVLRHSDSPNPWSVHTAHALLSDDEIQIVLGYKSVGFVLVVPTNLVHQIDVGKQVITIGSAHPIIYGKRVLLSSFENYTPSTDFQSAYVSQT